LSLCHEATALARCSQELGSWVQAVTIRSSAIAEVQTLSSRRNQPAATSIL